MKKNIKSVFTDYTISSGNVFGDLELPNPEELLTKADLVFQINNLIEAKGLTQAEAARLLDIDQPKISALNTGKLPYPSIGLRINSAWRSRVAIFL